MLRNKTIWSYLIRTAWLQICLAVISSSSFAAPIAIVNHSFESNPAPVPSDITSGVANGWSPYNPMSTAGVFYGSLFAAPDNYPAGAPDGDHVQVNFISANNPAGEEFGVFQTLNATLEENTIYTLTVEVGNINSGFNDLNATPNDPNDDPFFNIMGFNGYRVELRTDSVSGSGSTLIADTLSNTDGNDIPDGEFRTVTLTYDSRNATISLIGEQLEILLVNLNEIDPNFVGHDRETNFDNVRLNTGPAPLKSSKVPMPESALFIFGFSIFALAIVRTRIPR
ncbi:MAG: hypothetical protein AAF387_03360 [Pseudomonadota bacterium]